MNGRTKRKAAPSKVLSVRLSLDDAAYAEAEATAAGLTTSRYISRLMNDRHYRRYPSTAALAQIIAIVDLAREHGLVSNDVTRLEKLVAQLCIAVRDEALP